MQSTDTSGVFARQFEEIGRAVEVGFAGGRVIAVSFPAETPADAETDHALLDRIGAYLRDEPADGGSAGNSVGGTDTAGGGAEPTTRGAAPFSDVQIGLTVPTDRRRVLDALRSVPTGESVSVSRLTRSAGYDDNDADDLDTVTRALRENPIPLLLPDHRVQGGPYATPGEVRDVLRRVEAI
ncbi:MGMT family protein [Halorubrum sp. BV1]|uniref:MGMT family protein n=1 Tax=Halorubrum sp. BV1 TaxID=1498500 RepID=UPI0006794EDA|nr:MGMT family protein [Halorubrum sp. BV1]